ncbi:cupin domain-containing protein [Leptolyngbya sp. PCC 6406]|uniref:cupin domain-containing protein n=1 Tax=Leptolyngbya sp. PCC 6406 TaxID=1173264 RepID=UPI0002AC839B|nr:cupin domain-containing protein [Leptolyngbya sp. PCC 6406]
MPYLLTDLWNLAERADTLPWQPFRPGVKMYRLYGDSHGPSAALLRYEPGAQVPHHDHSGYEHIIVLSGSQQDQHQTYGAGTLVINEPGTDHAIASPEGCLVLVIWEKPVILRQDS